MRPLRWIELKRRNLELRTEREGLVIREQQPVSPHGAMQDSKVGWGKVTGGSRLGEWFLRGLHKGGE